ncbi:MAG: response regulator [Myxococcales bacterium]|nr:response regulator [Myxococcales bacterium]
MQKKILIVEEEAPIADALLGRLRARGYAPTRVTAPDEALAAFDAERPDLVVASLTLPDDGGRRVCRDIRRRPLGALVPILFVGTGREDVHSVSEAIAAGADHFFVKPHGVGDLVAKVTTYIGPGGEPSVPPTEAAEAPPRPTDPPRPAPGSAPPAAAPLAEEPTIAEPPPPGDRYAWSLDDEAPAAPALGAVPQTADAPRPAASPPRPRWTSAPAPASARPPRRRRTPRACGSRCCAPGAPRPSPSAASASCWPPRRGPASPGASRSPRPACCAACSSRPASRCTPTAAPTPRISPRTWPPRAWWPARPSSAPAPAWPRSAARPRSC